MGPTFRVATEADLDPLIEFMRQLYEQDQYPFDETMARRALAGLIGDPVLGRVWVIEGEDYQAVGYLAVTFGYSLEYHGRDAFIDEIFVQASHRHRGIGTRAMRFAIERCRELGINALHLEVERANIVAQQVYRKAGFEDGDRYLMSRWLNR